MGYNSMMKTSIALSFILLLSSCASLISSVTSDMADNLTQAILNQNDLETVRDGAPAYLLMIDSMIEGDRENPRLLLSGAKLYGAYTTLFVDDTERANRLSKTSLEYAQAALCLELESVCAALDAKQVEFEVTLSELSKSDVTVLYGFASAWAGWIQRNTSDWNALANLPKLTAMFERSVKLDGSHDSGGAHLYLAVLASQLPPSLGGKPEQGRAHFEQAHEYASGHNLMVDVFMAQYYARTIFDKDLHDQLLRSVLADTAEYPGFTLINAFARQRATQLLAESDEYF